jgi:uncharacterized protein (DUF1697 family)
MDYFVRMTSTRYAALLRGVNVGTTKRIAMADLRAAFEAEGFDNVRTLLQSGNVVFDSADPVDADRIESLIDRATGAHPRVVLLDAATLREVLDENPLAEMADDPSRLLITFVDEVPDGTAIRRPSDDELLPEVVVFGRHAIYQWLPLGVSQSRLPAGFAKALGATATARNLRTAEKLLALLEEH